MLINGIVRTRAIYRIQITASLSDEDAVYLIDSVVGGLHRGYDPLLFARAFDLHAKTETMTVLLRAFRCRSSSSVCRAVGHQGYFGKRCFRLCHLRNSRTQVDKFRQAYALNSSYVMTGRKYALI